MGFKSYIFDRDEALARLWSNTKVKPRKRILVKLETQFDMYPECAICEAKGGRLIRFLWKVHHRGSSLLGTYLGESNCVVWICVDFEACDYRRAVRSS